MRKRDCGDWATATSPPFLDPKGLIRWGEILQERLQRPLPADVDPLNLVKTAENQLLACEGRLSLWTTESEMLRERVADMEAQGLPTRQWQEVAEVAEVAIQVWTSNCDNIGRAIRTFPAAVGAHTAEPGSSGSPVFNSLFTYAVDLTGVSFSQ